MNQQLETLQTNTPAAAGATAECTKVAIPRADVWDEGDALALTVDLPGVTASSLEVTVEGSELVLHGQRTIELPDGAQAAHLEYEPVSYHRVFRLGENIDRQKIEVRLRDGVARLRLPKRQEAQPRRIHIQTQ